HLDGRAVGIGDDSLVPGDVVRVDLGHDQRHVRVHPEGTRIVDDDRSGRRGDRAPFPGHGARSARQDDVDAAERVAHDRLDRKGFAPKGHRLADASLGGQELDRCHRKGPLLQQADHPVSHGSTGPDDGDVLHDRTPLALRNTITRQGRDRFSGSTPTPGFRGKMLAEYVTISYDPTVWEATRSGPTAPLAAVRSHESILE